MYIYICIYIYVYTYKWLHFPGGTREKRVKDTAPASSAVTMDHSNSYFMSGEECLRSKEILIWPKFILS